MFEYVLIGWAALVGLLIGGALVRAASRKIQAEARVRAETIAVAGRRVVELALKAAQSQAREDALQLRTATEATARQFHEQSVLLEERIRRLEARNEKHERANDVREAALEVRETAVRERKAEARELRHEAKRLRQGVRGALEERAGETAEEIRLQLTERLVEEVRAEAADRLRNLEAEDAEELGREAKRVMGIALGRYREHLIIERLVSTVQLPKGGAERLQKGDHLTRLEETTGVRLVLADSGESVRLEGGEATSRELARRAIARFAAEGHVREPERLLGSITADLDREISETGKRAFKILSLEPSHPDIIRLLGRLSFRTSYTQNQWRHSIEAAFLAAMMASELGLDPVVARRSTLLHDIGKAYTHEREGSHALLGAEQARALGEPEIVANAIASHHGDEPQRSAYAYLVTAADAMSGARPGARREMVETYVERISDLERIASGFAGVTTAHAVQAGREVRVHVDEGRVDDARAARMSDEIAEKIGAELSFPGQIRVTVIREFRAVELAS